MHGRTDQTEPELFAGNTEMARLVRAFDWEATPLGPFADWPLSLKTVAGVVLTSYFPNMIVWGPDLLQIYNDGFSQILGSKHPRALGQPNAKCWPEVWDFNRPIFERVFEGETVHFEDKHFRLNRGQGGAPEDAFLKVCYSPIPTESGLIGGAIVTAIETTRRIRAEDALRDSESRLRFQAHLLDAVDEAVIATDMAGNVVYWNRFAETLYGWTAEEAMGRHVLDLKVAPEGKEEAADLLRHLQAGQSWSGEIVLTHRDGRKFPVQVTDSPVYDQAGRLIAIVGISSDVTQRRKAEEHQRLLINELNHRVKNTLATVQSIASQTLRNAPGLDTAQTDIEARLIALSRAHDVLTRENWERVRLRDIVDQAVEPYSNQREDRLHIEGPEIRLPPRVALALAMALQELATNAVKYGALSNETGEIRITWSVSLVSSPPHVRMIWEEKGGPTVAPPKRRGFGSRLIERSLASDLGGRVNIEFAASGVVCTLEAPFDDP
jgi:PAS domain S-box-containing protein